MDKIENQEKLVELLLENGAKDFCAIFGAAGKNGSFTLWLIDLTKLGSAAEPLLTWNFSL